MGRAVCPPNSEAVVRKMRLSLVTALIAVFWSVPAVSQTASPRQPTQVYHTETSDIIFTEDADLLELARRLGAAGPAGSLGAELATLAAGIDGMLAEISRVLQRRPLKPVRLRIQLLRDGFQVAQQQAAVRSALLHRVLPGRGFLVSFYEPRSRTIFLSLADARLGVLAHEMTHFLLCESSRVWPSETYQESLARYMEDRFNAGK